jgi:uncharacterized protein YbaR (Trm112 family)
MIHNTLLESLVCPENRSPLSVADAALLRRVNDAVRAGRLRNRGGQTLSEPIEAALLRADGAVIYRIQDGIPIMLVDEAIPLTQLGE